MKRLLRNKFVIGLFCTLFALPVIAQEDELKDLPGYVDFGDLSLTYGEPKITINLGGTMLNFVGMMSASESPETSEMISKLKGIRVQIYSIEENAEVARNQFGDTKSSLKSSGWEPIVQVNEDDEQVLVYMKAIDGHMEVCGPTSRKHFGCNLQNTMVPDHRAVIGARTVYIENQGIRGHTDDAGKDFPEPGNLKHDAAALQARILIVDVTSHWVRLSV